jgi:hypothetical protein
MGLASLVLALALVAPVAATAADPAQRALAGRDAYVSPRVLGPAAAQEQQLLIAVAARLKEEGRPVKLAVVLGPVGAPSLRAYVRRLGERLAFEGTVVATTPTGAVAASGPRPPATIARALTDARVGRIANPVERLTAAAAVAAPAPIDADEVSTRTILILLAVGLLGGLWAFAIGAGRTERQDRRDLAEARARTRICLDALRARATTLMRRDDLPPPARAGVGRALGAYADAVTSLQEMRAVGQVDALAPAVHEGMDEVARAADAVGQDMPSEDPFAGLCALDPAHGPRLDPAPLCGRCDDAAGRGEPPLPRMLSVGGRPVPFDAVSYGPVLRPAEARRRPSPPPRASPS